MITFISKEKIAVLSNTVMMKCEVDGVPNPVVSWTKKGDLDFKYFGNELRLENIEASDKGVYTCTASNTDGGDAKDVNLLVRREYFDRLDLIFCDRLAHSVERLPCSQKVASSIPASFNSTYE